MHELSVVSNCLQNIIMHNSLCGFASTFNVGLHVQEVENQTFYHRSDYCINQFYSKH